MQKFFNQTLHDKLIRKYSKDEVLNLNIQELVTLLAPTGIAAYIISGKTIHSALKIPIQHGSILQNYALKSDDLKLFRQKYKNIKLIIIGN